MTDQVPPKPKGKKQRVLTFLIKDGENLSLVHHRTVASSVAAAFDEKKKETPALADKKLLGAVAGKVDWLKNELRSQSKEEMAARIKELEKNQA